MGKGKDLFGHFNDLGREQGPESEACHYAGILFQALLIVGERKVFELLEEADETGQKLALQYSNMPGEDSGTPIGVMLV